jgi:hypothetical protein
LISCTYSFPYGGYGQASLFKERHDTDNKPSCLNSVGVKLKITTSMPTASLAAFGRLQPSTKGTLSRYQPAGQVGTGQNRQPSDLKLRSMLDTGLSSPQSLPMSALSQLKLSENNYSLVGEYL